VSRWVLHVDLDQFLAAVEVLRHPELRGRPVIVGGDGDPTKRGVVSTASYEARGYGVHSGMALRTAARRCPQAVFLPVDRDVYEAVSTRVMAALKQFDAVVEVLGWDEAFLGVHSDNPETLARAIQTRVREATQLDSTVGIGHNRLQAKLATAFGKPAGVFRLTDQNWFTVLGDQPTDALWGIGAKTAKRLARLNIHTVTELAAAKPQALAATIGPTIGPWLISLAHGLASTSVRDTPHLARSRSRETTFQHDLHDWDRVHGEICRLARMLADDIAAERRQISRLVVKVRYAPFLTHTHGQPLPNPTKDHAAIEAAALAALDQFSERRPVRLLGVRGEFADHPSPRTRAH
jgi:nucleotidyltransferase/DNA polymerase involved in DNA repair